MSIVPTRDMSVDPEDADIPEDVRFYSKPAEEPRGGPITVPYIGKTKRFSSQQVLNAVPSASRATFLEYHVPISMRGPYKIDSVRGELNERRGENDYALCTYVKDPNTGDLCRSKARNRSGRCEHHGGALCPLDRKVTDWSRAPRAVRFKYGKLDVDELDDQELARGQVRKEDGTWTRYKSIDRSMHQKMVNKLFERADEKMRNELLNMVDVFAEIAKGDAFEPADRLRAAEFVFTWLRGKTPTVVEIGVAKPFENVLDAVLSGGSRSESRERRGIANEEILEAEVVEDDELDLPDLRGAVGEEDEEAEDSSGTEDPGKVVSYEDDEDHRISREFEPKRPEHVGPAGAPTYVYHPSAGGLSNHRRMENEEIAAAEQRKADFSKKRDPEEVKEERSAHKEAMRLALQKRKYFQNEGYTSLPKPLEYEFTEKTVQGEEWVLIRWKKP